MKDLKIDAIMPLVDTMSLYQVLSLLKTKHSLVFNHTREFLIAKLRSELPGLKQAIRYTEAELEKIAPKKPKQRRKKSV